MSKTKFEVLDVMDEVWSEVRTLVQAVKGKVVCSSLKNFDIEECVTKVFISLSRKFKKTITKSKLCFVSQNVNVKITPKIKLKWVCFEMQLIDRYYRNT